MYAPLRPWLLLILLCTPPGQTSDPPDPSTSTKPKRQLKRKYPLQDGCVIETDVFRSDATVERESFDGGRETTTPWQASVSLKFDLKNGRYIIDYATLGENRTTYAGNRVAPVVETKTLWWLFEVDWLPFMEPLRKVEAPGCSETVYAWGKALLRKERGGGAAVDESSAVLAVVREALRESTLAEDDNGRTEGPVHMFGPSESLLPATTTLFWLARVNRFVVSSIKFVDYETGNDTIDLPLESNDVHLMRYMMTVAKKGCTREDPIYTSIADYAVTWGIDLREKGISQKQYNSRVGATAAAVAAGWNERLAPEEED
ncbi:hypothetical protein FOZ62_002219 [Perkinsus olseni]|uniref:Uncharacterized protein n=1 Tax=Perkinsus olseni TaxID=32597 RepID=A0A7J6T0V9_PEROL|nr:hypothetical protein FOZ62_002219 [Perkinsus olseni]